MVIIKTGVDEMKKVAGINLGVGNAIRKGLRRRGMTQEELATLAGSAQRSVFSYISENAQPPLDTPPLICHVLEVDMNQVLQILDLNFPRRILHDPIELEFMRIFDQVPEERQMTSIKLMKDILSSRLE